MRVRLAATLVALALAAPAVAQPQVEIGVEPARVFIEAGDLQQLNFDFRIENRGSIPLTLRSVLLSVHDRNGGLVLRRDVDGSGSSPAVFTLGPDRSAAAGDTSLLFNPFTTFPAGLPLHRLVYRLRFDAEGEPVEREVVVMPRPWVPRTRLLLPGTGRLWVEHGHDYLSHHRRWNTQHPIAVAFGATANFQRYALDLLVVDERGEPRRGQSETNADYFGWEAPLRAPADGVVVAAHDSESDDDLATRRSAFDPDRLPREPLHFYGNYLIIDHGGGEFSLLGHLRQNSVTVRVGDRVRGGQRVARLGASGSAEFRPHLHYELRSGPTMRADGLPAYFTGFARLQGARRIAVRQGPINSGEIVQSGR